MIVKSMLDSLAAGGRAKGKIPAGTMASGAEIAIPFVAVKGAKPGPCLWINGQVHGNEINGIFAALDFYNGLDPAKLSGSVVVTAMASTTPAGAGARWRPAASARSPPTAGAASTTPALRSSQAGGPTGRS